MSFLLDSYSNKYSLQKYPTDFLVSIYSDISEEDVWLTSSLVEDDNYIDIILPDPNAETFNVDTNTYIDSHGMNNSVDITAGPLLAEGLSSRPTRTIKPPIYIWKIMSVLLEAKNTSIILPIAYLTAD